MKRIGVLVASTMAGLASLVYAGDLGVGWESIISPPPLPIQATHVPWYDALDASAGARFATDASIGVDVSLRWRLDAPEFLARAADDARDLAEHATALAMQAWSLDQLERIARSCEDAWRSTQVAMIDRFLALPGRSDDVAAELGIVSALLARPSQRQVDGATISACRLDDVVAALELASDHPRLVTATAEQRLGDRSARMLEIAPPVSVWLHADLWHDRMHARGGVRVGMDVPLPSTVGATEMSFSTDGRSADVGVRWAHAAGSVHRGASVPRTKVAIDHVEELEAALARLRLEVQLRRLDATRRWSDACGDDTVLALDACVRGTPLDPLSLDIVFAAIDAELFVLHTALAAIEASGQPLTRLMEGR